MDRIVDGEMRWQTTGLVDAVMILMVAHTWMEETDGSQIIRVISARKATSYERKRYEQERRHYR